MQDSGMQVMPIVLFVIFAVVMVIPYVKIIRKAGFSGWWVLVLFVPLLNFVMLWVFAFARWPLEDRAAGLGVDKVFS